MITTTSSHANVHAAAQAAAGAPTTPIDVGIPNFVAWYRAYHGL